MHNHYLFTGPEKDEWKKTNDWVKQKSYQDKIQTNYYDQGSIFEMLE